MDFIPVTKFTTDTDWPVPTSPARRYREWARVSHAAPEGFSQQEIRVRNILGLTWDANHSQDEPKRFFCPMSVVALPDGKEAARSFVLSLVGFIPYGHAILLSFGDAGFLMPNGDPLAAKELLNLIDFIHTLFEQGYSSVPIGSTWISHDRNGKELPFPSGRTWADMPLR
jgi:hypothetical protein